MKKVIALTIVLFLLISCAIGCTPKNENTPESTSNVESNAPQSEKGETEATEPPLTKEPDDDPPMTTEPDDDPPATTEPEENPVISEELKNYYENQWISSGNFELAGQTAVSKTESEGTSAVMVTTAGLYYMELPNGKVALWENEDSTYIYLFIMTPSDDGMMTVGYFTSLSNEEAASLVPSGEEEDSGFNPNPDEVISVEYLGRQVIDGRETDIVRMTTQYDPNAGYDWDDDWGEDDDWGDTDLGEGDEIGDTYGEGDGEGDGEEPTLVTESALIYIDASSGKIYRMVAESESQKFDLETGEYVPVLTTLTVDYVESFTPDLPEVTYQEVDAETFYTAYLTAVFSIMMGG
ncbi:MAG: hypothetical protein II797_01075 [Clostridia bacterium]|nr:hypothetical protein [Clostridia bacterium]